MVYYSELIGKRIIDKNHKKVGHVKDLCFIDGSRYAKISGIIIKYKGDLKKISWKNVLEIGDDPNAPYPFSIYLNQEFKHVRLRHIKENVLHTIIDKQLIDINGARVIRVNDILLGQSGKKLILVGVDVSTKGLMKRLGLGFVPLRIHEHIIPWKDVAPLSDDIKDLKLKVKRDRLNELHPAELADMIRDLNLEEKTMFFNTLDKEKAATALLTSQPEVQKTFLKSLSLKNIARLLETMPSDDSAALLEMMPTFTSEKVLKLIKPGIAAKIKKFHEYDKKTAGSLMTTRFLNIPKGLNVREAIKYIKKESPHPKHVFYLYVEGENKELKGIISLRDLLLANPNDRISIMTRMNIITVNVNTDIEEVFNLMSKYSLLALPVLDKGKKIVGVIRINDILEVMVPNRIKKQRIIHTKKLQSLNNNHNHNSTDLNISNNIK